MCPECKEKQPLFEDRDRQVSGQGNQAAGGYVAEALSSGYDNELPLLALLRQLAPVAPARIPEVVPRRAERRFGRLGRKVLDDLMASICAGADDWKLEESTRLLLALPVLLLRRPVLPPPGSDEGDVCRDPAREPKQWKILRSRLQLAEAARWHQLVAEALGDDCAARGHGSRDADWATAAPEVEDGEERFRRRSIAASRVPSDCIRSAAQLLKGQSMLPPCAATADKVKALLATSLSEEQKEEQWNALDRAWRAGEGHGLHIQPWHVAARVADLRVGAQPGPSKTRNNMVKLIEQAPGGRDSLVAWCQHWADGYVPPVVSQLLSAQVIRPLKKPSGGPRNISLLEALFKLASAVVQTPIREARPDEGWD